MEHFDQGKSKMGQGKSGENQGICFLKVCGHPGSVHNDNIITFFYCRNEISK